MIDSYKPEGWENTHFIRITFMYQEFVGHVIIQMGGNIKGADVLREALEFWVYADEDDIRNSIIENDCKLKLHKDKEEDEFWYSMEMKQPGKDEYLIHDDLNDTELQDMIVSAEIVGCEPE